MKNLGTQENLAALAQDFLRQLPAEFPNIADHVRWHLKPQDADDQGAFAFGLDLILDGLESMRRAASR